MSKVLVKPSAVIAPVKFGPNDFGLIRGQEAVKRAILVGLCGGHSVLLLGPKGNGKTMLCDAARYLEPEHSTFDITEVRTGSLHDSPETLKMLEQCEDSTAEIHVEVPRVPFRDLFGSRPGTDSAFFQKVMNRTFEFQKANPNRSLTLDETSQMLMKQAYDELNLTPRACMESVKVARTIADMECVLEIGCHHLAESVQYRLLDRGK